MAIRERTKPRNARDGGDYDQLLKIPWLVPMGFAIGTVALIVSGSLNTIAARNEADALVAVNRIAGPVHGLDVPHVRLLTGVAVVLVLLTALVMLREESRWTRVVFAAEVLSIAILWYNNWILSSTPVIINGGGPNNVWYRVGSQVNHAGWLLAGAVALCFLSVWARNRLRVR